LLTVRWYGHIKRTNNEGVPKHIVNARREGAEESGRSWEKLNDEVEEDL
jgi:hypothetical protein